MLQRVTTAFVRRLALFLGERKGQVALTFALAALPALLTVGAAIDYSRAVSQRSNLQQATDATVLAIAHTYLTPTSTNLTLFPTTQTYLTGVMGSVAPSNVTVTINGIVGTPNAATLQSITLSQNNTVMCIRTTMVVPTMMMTIAHINYLGVGTSACSQVGGTYEVAMVLDNSYSMSESLSSGTKMDALHSAAGSLVDILIPDGTIAPTASISLVPFNALVNVGTSRTAAFLDTNGQSSLTWKEIGKPSWITAHKPSRFDLFDTLYNGSAKTQGIPWGGCVEDRPNNVNSSTAPDNTNYLTTDVAASSGDSMVTPYFAPDDPGSIDNANYNYYNVIQYLYEDFSDCMTYSSTSTKGNCKNNTQTYRFLNSYLTDSGYQGGGLSACTSTDWANDNKTTNIYPGSGMTLACKYKNAVATVNSQWFGLTAGPNSNCSTPAITPLTTNKTNLKTAIGAMQPTGLTNLGTGFMWGWRTISPVFNPYPISNPAIIGQQNPKTYGYGPPPNTKVIILMTDGYNTWSPIILTSAYGTFGVNNPYKSSYETFGYMTDNRLANYSTTCPSTGSSSAITGSGFVTDMYGFRCQMDNELLEACSNAKTAGIVIYTVGFSISSDAIDQEGINVLKGCASAPANYYQAADGSGIITAFQQIAASITNLRLSR